MSEVLWARDPEQARKIKEAVEEAVKRRDKYSDQRVKEMAEALTGAARDVRKEIARFEEKTARKPWQEMRMEILKELDGEITGISKELHDTWKVGIRSHVEGSMKLGIEDGLGQVVAAQMPDFHDLDDVSKNTLVKKTFTTVDRSAVDFLANYQVNLLGEVSAELATSIKRTIAQGVLTGKSIRDIAKDILGGVPDKEIFKTAGKTTFKSAYERAKLIARTETLRAHNEGRKVFYREVGVKKVRWMTAHDERLCPECNPLDGVVFKVDEAPGPPKHPGCRCTVTALIPPD